MNRARAAAPAPGKFTGAVRNDLIQIHMSLRARAGLPNRERKFFSMPPGNDFIGGGHNHARLSSGNTPSARISSGDGFSVEILKFRSERCVCAPHRRAAGTAISPKVSCSRRVVSIIRAQYHPVLMLTLYSRFT